MRTIERETVKTMIRNEVIMRAIAGKLTWWIQAADICWITARQMRRMKQRCEAYGYDRWWMAAVAAGWSARQIGCDGGLKVTALIRPAWRVNMARHHVTVRSATP